MTRIALLAIGFMVAMALPAASQDVCNQSYLACMTRCTTEQPTAATQDRCMQSCQGANNTCSATYFAPRSAYQEAYGAPAAAEPSGRTPRKRQRKVNSPRP